MANYTIDTLRRRRIGNKRMCSGGLTCLATSGDVVTPLKRIETFQICGYSNTDMSVSVARNTTGTTDNANDAMGTAHLAGVSIGLYRFIATGT